MPRALTYHRPASLDDALALLALDDHVPLGGGTILNADDDPTPVAMVDLQALDLGGITADGDEVTIGATTSLQEIANDDRVPEVIRRAARAELPSTLRTLATLGGTVAAAGPDSLLFAALLVHEARVDSVGPDGKSDHSLADRPASSGGLVVSVSVATDGFSTHESTGRTPADTPIVSATARRTGQRMLLVLTGVADRPTLVDPNDPTTSLDPVGDFRGSAGYRLHLAGVLTARVVTATGGGT